MYFDAETQTMDYDGDESIDVVSGGYFITRISVQLGDADSSTKEYE